MMQKRSPKKLDLKFSPQVIDIVQFGSSVIEDKAFNDIDIAIIFEKIPLKDQLSQAQEIKKQLKNIYEKDIHVKTYDFRTLFDESNFAREGILFYGISLVNEKYFAEKLGLKPRMQIEYDLKDMQKKDKVRFHYLLKGKKNGSGLLIEYGGELVKPGLIEFEPRFEKIFTDKIKEEISSYNIKKIFCTK